MRPGFGDLPRVLDVEVSVSDVSRFYAQSGTALPQVNLKAFRLDQEIDAIKAGDDRQRWALKLDNSGSAL